MDHFACASSGSTGTPQRAAPGVITLVAAFGASGHSLRPQHRCTVWLSHIPPRGSEGRGTLLAPVASAQTRSVDSAGRRRTSSRRTPEWEHWPSPAPGGMHRFRRLTPITAPWRPLMVTVVQTHRPRAPTNMIVHCPRTTLYVPRRPTPGGVVAHGAYTLCRSDHAHVRSRIRIPGARYPRGREIANILVARHTRTRNSEASSSGTPPAASASPWSAFPAPSTSTDPCIDNLRRVSELVGRRCRYSTGCSNDVEPPTRPSSRGCDVLRSPRPAPGRSPRGATRDPGGSSHPARPHPDTASDEQRPTAPASNRLPTARHVSRETDTGGGASTDAAIERAGVKAVGPGVPLNSTMRVRQAAHTRTPPTPCTPQMLSRRFSAGREAASARSVIDHVSWSPKKAPAHGRPPGQTFVPLDATGTNSYETLSAIAQT